jgi:hypothetical protein
MKRHLATLLAIWWAGAAVATAAIFFPIYNDYLVVGMIGWGVVAVATVLIFIEMRRVKADDKRKEDLKSG